jgi:hypothetical protein
MWKFTQHAAALRPADAQAARNMSASDGKYMFERGFPTSETAQRIHDEQNYERAVQAHEFFYPTISVEGMLQGARDAGMKDNKGALIFYCGPKNVLFTANSDTPYLFATLDLKESGSMVVELRAGPYIGLFDDHNFRYVRSLSA